MKVDLIIATPPKGQGKTQYNYQIYLNPNRNFMEHIAFH